jgi:hypothetical protein
MRSLFYICLFAIAFQARADDSPAVFLGVTPETPKSQAAILIQVRSQPKDERTGPALFALGIKRKVPWPKSDSIPWTGVGWNRVVVVKPGTYDLVGNCEASIRGGHVEATLDAEGGRTYLVFCKGRTARAFKLMIVPADA